PLIILLLPRSTLFPYTTLFRSTSHLSILLFFTFYMFSFHFSFLSFFFFFFLLRISLVIHLLLPPFRSILSARSLPQSLPPLSLQDRKSTRLNSSHDQTSYAVFC